MYKIVFRDEPVPSVDVLDVVLVIEEPVIADAVGDLSCVLEIAHGLDVDRAVVVLKERADRVVVAAVQVLVVDIPRDVVVSVYVVIAKHPPALFPDHGLVIALERTSDRVCPADAVERGVLRTVFKRCLVLARADKTDILDRQRVVIGSDTALDRGLDAVLPAAAQDHDHAAGAGFPLDLDRAGIGCSRDEIDVEPARFCGCFFHERRDLAVQRFDRIGLVGIDRPLIRRFPRRVAADPVFFSVQLAGRGDLPRAVHRAVDEAESVDRPSLLGGLDPLRRARVSGRAAGG